MVRRDTKLGDLLRRKIARSDMSANAICKAAGIDPAALSRFVNGQTGLSMEAIDSLLDFFGLEIRPKAKRARKGR